MFFRFPVSKLKEGECGRMKCKRIRKKWLSWLDGDLPEHERRVIEEHIDGCSSCRTLSERFKSLWTPPLVKEKAVPSPLIWSRIFMHIQGNGAGKRSARILPLYRMRYSYRIAGVFVILSGIAAGILLGSFPKSLNTDVRLDKPVHSSAGKYSELEILDSFYNFPPLSLGSIYLAMMTDNEGGACR